MPSDRVEDTRQPPEPSPAEEAFAERLGDALLACEKLSLILFDLQADGNGATYRAMKLVDQALEKLGDAEYEPEDDEPEEDD